MNFRNSREFAFGRPTAAPLKRPAATRRGFPRIAFDFSQCGFRKLLCYIRKITISLAALELKFVFIMGNLENECYELIGLCMEVHRELGPGFSEAIYKDALEIELKKHNIPYQREKTFKVQYKGETLPRKYKADFIVYNAIILEAKAVSAIIEDFVKITINYLKVSGLKLGIIGNFGERSFKYRRVVFQY